MESPRDFLTHASRGLLARVRGHKIRFGLCLLVSLLSALLISHLLGDHFNVAHQKLRGEPSTTGQRNTRQVSGDAQQQAGIDPFASRPRIETRNGHLILQASQDKNIDFKTSGSRGTITINGYKLDQLIGVAKALERTSTGSGLLVGSEVQLGGPNGSSSLLATGSVQDRYEFVLRSLFGSAEKLKRMDERTLDLDEQLGALETSVKKLSGRLTKRSKQLANMRDSLGQVLKKLKENNCVNPSDGLPVCKNGAECVDLYDSYKCLCPREFEGAQCQVDVDECAKFRGTELGCQNGGKCVNLIGGYRCECPAAFHGIHCTEQHDDCSLASSSSMCGHGKCVNVARQQANQPAYECICDQGWTTEGSGKSPACVIDINECLAGQVLGGNSTSLQVGGESASLAAAGGYNLAYPCSQNPYVECINLPGSFVCEPCPPGYQGNGRVCRDIDECLVNNGGCSRSPLVECLNLPGGRKCGPCPPGYTSQDDSVTCKRVPACQQELNGGCHPMAKCVELAGVANQDASRLCICNYPFVGPGVGPVGCTRVVGSAGTPPASDTPPLLPALPDESNFSMSGASGELAGGGRHVAGAVQVSPTTTTKQDDCQPSPCLNGGQCLYADASFECACPPAWTGKICELDASEQLACGGRLPASQGSLVFPLGGSYERLLRISGAARTPTRRPNSGGDGSSPPQELVRCVWSLAAPANMSLRLSFSDLRSASRSRSHPAGQVQVHSFAVGSTPGASVRQLPTCSEFLDVRERLEAALEQAGVRGRLLARICAQPTAPGGPKPVEPVGSISSKPAATDEGPSLVSESNMVDLEYNFGGAARAAITHPVEPSLTFQVRWERSEPPCGGLLPLASSGSINSPRFPDFYPAGTECRFVLRVKPGQRIRMQFGELNLLSGRPAAASDPSAPCADSLTILDGAVGFERPVIFRHCANQRGQPASASWWQPAAALASEHQSGGPRPTVGAAGQEPPLVSSSSTVEVVLVSQPDSSVPLMRPKQKRGFYLTYAAEPSEPTCGGLYTSKAALIRSLDYVPVADGPGPAGGPEDSALAYEYAHYFDIRDNFNNFSPSAAAASSAGDSPAGNSTNSSTTRRPSSSLEEVAAARHKASRNSGPVSSHAYRTRCEYEIRPADQARNHRVQVDWLELPSELSLGTMSSLSKWSRRFRCMRSRLLIFDGNPSARQTAGESLSAQQTTTQANPNLLATFCAGDKYNASMAQLKPIASSGHLLFLVYESLASTSHSGGGDGAARGNTIAATPLADDSAHAARASAALGASGFRLRYSTRCSAIYRQLEGTIQTELDPEVDECLYHILLPPNNTISLLVEPVLAASDETGTGGGGQQLAKLTLPDGSCAAQAIFMDGAVPRGSPALAATERQLRSFDFSTGGSGGDLWGEGGGATPTSDSGTLQATRVATPAKSILDFLDESSPAEGGGKSKNGPPSSGASGASASSSSASGEPLAAKYSYWQHGSSQVHDIKEFDVCHLPALGVDSVWNEMSLMFRLNPKLKQLQAAEVPSSSSVGAGLAEPTISPARLKFVIKYSSEASCGGIISEPREGSIELVAQRLNANVFGSYSQIMSRYEGFLSHLFANQCAWILRNPRPGQPILVTFERVPTDEIKRRMSDWVAWLRGAGGDLSKSKRDERKKNKTATTPSATPTPTTTDDSLDGENGSSKSSTAQGDGQPRLGMANCNQAFQELIEFYEPATGRSRFVCPSELLDQPSLHWTSMGDTLYVRLLNDTTANLTQQVDSPAGQPQQQVVAPWPGRKPLKGLPMELHYVMLAQREENRGCGGKLLQSSGTIQTPRFPFNYPANSNCVWVIQAPQPDQQVRLNFSRFQLEEHSRCLFDYLEIRNGPTDRSPLMGRFCGKSLQGRLLVSQSGMLWLRFHSDAHLNSPGFRLEFDAATTGCGGLLTAARGQIDSPNYPYAYAHGADCEWTIEVAASNRVSLFVEDLDLSGTPGGKSDSAPPGGATATGIKQDAPCQFDGPQADYLEVFDGSLAQASTSLGRWCHLSQFKSGSRTLHSSSNKLHVVYRSQAQDRGRGFRLSYSTNCTFESELTGMSGAIESPGYPTDFSVSPCSWIVRAPLGSNLSVALTDYAPDDSYFVQYQWNPFDSIFGLNGNGSTTPTTNSPASSSSSSAAKQQSHNRLYDPRKGLRGEDVRLGAKCPTDQMELRFWSARVENSSVPLMRRLEPISSHFMQLYERKQWRQPNMTNYYNFTRSIYNFTLVRNLCTANLDDDQRVRTFEIPSNVLVVNQFAVPFLDQPRRFRLEWRARNACGSQQQQLAGAQGTRIIEGVRFDERLNLTRWQASQPVECLWSLDASRANRALEFDLTADMRLPPGLGESDHHQVAPPPAADNQNAGCKDASLTIYDGLTHSAPVLYKNCQLDGRQHETIFSTSGQLLVRYLSSGRHASGTSSPGRNFNLFGWASHKDGCSQSIFDLGTPFLQPAGTRTSPRYPDLYEARAYKCSSIIASLPSGRLRFTIDELDIPTTGSGDSGQDSDSSAVGFLEQRACLKSGNYLRLRGASSSSSSSVDVFCGKFERTSGLGLSSPGTLERSTFILEQPNAWLEFVTRGGGDSTRGRWKVSYDRLCGASVTQLRMAEEFSTPNYPARPRWPSTSASSPQATEQVCIWRIKPEPASSWSDPGHASNQGEKLHFNLMNFNNPAEVEPLRTGSRDCIRVYEGYNISLRQATFNLTDMDARLEPRVKICSRADLKHNSMIYVSRGSELVIMTTGQVVAKFRVKPYENYCGGDFMLPAAEFATPHYPAPYANNLDCHYFIFGSPGSRINLRFDAFDLPPATQASELDSQAQQQTGASLSCDSTDYVELRQISSNQRVQLKLRGLIASRSPATGGAAAAAGSLGIDINEFLDWRRAGDVPQLADGVAQRTNSSKPRGALEAPGQVEARRKSLNRLLELAYLYHLFDESPANSIHQMLNRVRGHNSRLSIKLEDFYAQSTLIGRFCGKQAPRLPANLLHDELLVRFRSHGPATREAEQQQSRGFLASYKFEYGGTIRVGATEPGGGSSTPAWGFLSSPSYPDHLASNSTITWTLETQLDSVLELELVSLTLGSVRRPCQDTLSVFDGGPRVGAGTPKLVRWCGHLSFKRLLDRSMEKLWTSALEGSMSARRLPIHLAHEPQVQANLLRRVRSSSNVASVVYENLQSRGAFLLRYKSLPKSELQSNTTDPLEQPVEVEEALASQFTSFGSQEAEGPEALELAKTAAKSSCSRVYSLTPKNSPLGGLGANANDSALLSSPGWPTEVRDRDLECHWLVTTSDNTNIALRIDPSASMSPDWSAGQLPPTMGSRSSLSSSSDSCFGRAAASLPGARNFVVIHDGASTLAPVLGRFCLPAPPLQLASTGRHMLVRYVHAEPPPSVVSPPTADQTPEQGAQQVEAVRTSSLFRAQAQVGRCGGQFLIQYQEHIRDRPVRANEDSTGGRTGGGNSKLNYENNLNCLYFVFASSPNQVLTIHGEASEFKLASLTPGGATTEPNNSTDTDCSNAGDYLEVRDLPLQSDNFDFASESVTSGRLLGRFCAARPLASTLESPGPALVFQFVTDAQLSSRGWDLLMTAGEPRFSCPRSSLVLRPEEPWARFMSPGWPHGFTGTRRCKYNLLAPRNQSIEVTFVRLRRPVEWTGPGGTSSKCLDTFNYLDDAEASGVRFEYRPLRELRAPISGTQLRQLVQEVECAGPRLRAYSRATPLDPSTEASGPPSSPDTPTTTTTKRLVGLISASELAALAEATPTSGVYTIRSVSDNLLFEYSAKNLLPNEGFLAYIKLVDQLEGRKCGGEIEAKPPRNLLESASFGQRPNDTNTSPSAYTHCHWSLKFDSGASRDYALDAGTFGSSSKYFNLDTPGSTNSSATATTIAPAGEFKTAFLVFQALELAPQVQNTSLFEEQYGNYMESRASELCGLNRLLITDSHHFNALLACGYLTNSPQAAWTFVDELTSNEVLLRTRNTEQLVYDRWPDSTGAAQAVEGRSKLHRGMRAFFFESTCPRSERLMGETLRIVSHSGYWSQPRGGAQVAPSGGEKPLLTPLSYEPAICRWAIRLRPGHYEISFKSLNLRNSSTASQRSDKTATGKCTDLLGSDYVELRASSELDAPILARYCANNQLEAQKHSLPINSSMELSILFVAGLERLREGKDKFRDQSESGPPVQLLQPISTNDQKRQQAARALGFELLLTKVRNSTISEFCRRDSNYNIYQLIRNRERTQYYGSDYYSGTIAPSSLYPKNAHCSLDMSIDEGFRFNLSFTSFFDLEPSKDCKDDFIEISDLVERDPTNKLSLAGMTTTTRKPTGKPKIINRRLPTTTSTTTTTTNKPPTTNTTNAPIKSSSKIYEKVSLNLFQDLEPKLIGRWCGRNMPKGSFMSSTNKIRIVFHSDERIEGKGFILEWSAVPSNDTRTLSELEDEE